MKSEKLLSVSLLLACCFLLASAQTRPAIDGTWKLNPSKSKFGAKQGPRNLVERFDRQGATLRELLTVVNAKGTSTVTYNYSLDGKEIINVVDGEKVTTTARWAANVLVVEWKDDGGTFSRRFTFSENGNTLTVNAHDSSDDGESNETIVLDRQ